MNFRTKFLRRRASSDRADVKIKNPFLVSPLLFLFSLLNMRARICPFSKRMWTDVKRDWCQSRRELRLRLRIKHGHISTPSAARSDGRKTRETDGRFAKFSKGIHGSLESTRYLGRIARARGCDQPAARSPSPLRVPRHGRRRSSGSRVPTAAETFPRPLPPRRPLAVPTAVPPRPRGERSVPRSVSPSTRWPVKLRCYIHAAHLRSRSRATLPHFLSLRSLRLPSSLPLAVAMLSRRYAASWQPDFLSSSGGRYRRRER